MTKHIGAAVIDDSRTRSGKKSAASSLCTVTVVVYTLVWSCDLEQAAAVEAHF